MKVKSEFYFKTDLENILASLDKANGSIGDNIANKEVIIFRAGFRAALEALAYAVDVEIPKVSTVTMPIVVEGLSRIGEGEGS